MRSNWFATGGTVAHVIPGLTKKTVADAGGTKHFVQPVRTACGRATATVALDAGHLAACARCQGKIR